MSWVKDPDFSWLKLPDVYTVPRFQGNIIEQKTVNQLTPGMSREQVAYVMGTPLIQDAYHPDRWDYVYTTQIMQQGMTEERLTLYFEGDSLAKLEGDFKPEPVEEEDMVMDDSEPPKSRKEAKERLTPAAKSPASPYIAPAVGEDTTIYSGGRVNAIKPEGDVTETAATPKPGSANDPYKGLTPDGKLASPTPSPVAN